ncbi:MAG: zinc-dependent alcohol dehydrogenase family protein [Clostridia bacterium]|nr:zinc-dependent alcohol dehydrogenase family protein [Clostridia bacterium]
MRKGKAAVFQGQGQIRVEEREYPEPAGHEILVRVHFCGVCGTDVHIYEGDKGSADVDPPVVIGHEFSGEVAAVGDKVTRFRPGDRVTVDPNIYCGECYWCRHGRKQLCEQMQAYGVTMDGGFAEYALVLDSQAYRLPDNLSYAEGAMTEPTSCCLHGIDLTEIQAGETVMIVGCGNIGLIMIQLARLSGAAKIIGVDVAPDHLEMARQAGADILINSASDDTDAVLQENHVACVDRVIDCAGLPQTAEYCITHAGRGATVMLFGLTKPDDVARIKPFELFQKELTLRSSFVNPDVFDRSLGLLGSGKLDVKSQIRQLIPLEEIGRIFAEKLYRRGGKVLVNMEDDRRGAEK